MIYEFCGLATIDTGDEDLDARALDALAAALQLVPTPPAAPAGIMGFCLIHERLEPVMADAFRRRPACRPLDEERRGRPNGIA